MLARLLQNAEEATGKQVTKAVISVPAYFDEEQKAATTAAGQIAGLETVRLIRWVPQWQSLWLFVPRDHRVGSHPNATFFPLCCVRRPGSRLLLRLRMAWT